MVAVFFNRKEIIIVGLDREGKPLDPDGTLFGHQSGGRDLSDYYVVNADLSSGRRIHIPTHMPDVTVQA